MNPRTTYGYATSLLLEGVTAEQVRALTGWDVSDLIETPAAPPAATKPRQLETKGAAVAMLTGPCPCDACHWRARCARTRETCAAWRLYVQGAGEQRWRLAPRTPAS